MFLPGSSWLWSSVRRRAPTLVPWYAMCHFFSALETSQWGLILQKDDPLTYRHTVLDRTFVRMNKLASHTSKLTLK